MATTDGDRVIAIAELDTDSELTSLFEERDARSAPHIVGRLDDPGGLGLGEMEESGIDAQMFRLAAPSTRRLDPETAVREAGDVNGNPNRLLKI